MDELAEGIAHVTHFAKYFAPLEFDPNATRTANLQCESFVWSDEIPPYVDDGYPVSIGSFILALLSYRRKLMYGEKVLSFEPLWLHFKKCVPNWPGFRPERILPELQTPLTQELDQQCDDLDRWFAIRQKKVLRDRTKMEKPKERLKDEDNTK